MAPRQHRAQQQDPPRTPRGGSHSICPQEDAPERACELGQLEEQTTREYQGMHTSRTWAQHSTRKEVAESDGAGSGARLGGLGGREPRATEAREALWKMFTGN